MDSNNERTGLIKYLKENGLYIVKPSDFETLVNVAGKSYIDYPLDIYFYGGKYKKV